MSCPTPDPDRPIRSDWIESHPTLVLDVKKASDNGFFTSNLSLSLHSLHFLLEIVFRDLFLPRSTSFLKN